MLFYLIQTNFIDFTIILFIYIFLLTNQTLEKEMTRLFFLAAVLVNILMFADMLDYYYASLPSPNAFRYITSATGYTLRPCIIITILLSQRKNIRRIFTYIAVPFIINAFVAFGSYFTHLMFYFDEQNQFHRGPLGLLPFLLSGFYLIILTVWAFQCFRIGDKKESAVVLLVAFMAVVGVCMESFFHFKFIINGVGAVSIVFYYLFLHTQTFKRDALTKVLNRHSFYADQERLQAVPMTIVSVDMNNLKTINDRMGHDAGDKAIQTVAGSLIAVMQRGSLLYRTGGDEFMVLCPKMPEEDAAEMIADAEREINRAGYSIAWGMAAYQPSMDIHKVISLSDQRMYEKKQQMKRQDSTAAQSSRPSPS